MRTLAVAIIFALAGTASGQAVAEGRPCDKKPFTKAFDTCVKLANGKQMMVTICKNTLNAAMEAACGLTPSGDFTKKLITDMARTALTECLLKSEAEADKEKCRNTFETVTGITDKVTEKLEEIRGAMDSVAAKMKTCTDDKKKCKEDLTKNLKKLTGRDVTKDELRTMLDDAGMTEAAMKIKDCISMAADVDAQKTCFLSEKAEEAKQAFAQASGQLVTSITNSDLHKAVQKLARKDTFDTFNACLQGAANAAAKKACFKSDDLKRAIAGAEGGGAARVTDGKVREYLERQGKSEQLALISNCVKGGGEDCKTAMKELKAKMTGMLPSQITDFDIKKDIMNALPAHISERMQACMAEADDTTAGGRRLMLCSNWETVSECESGNDGGCDCVWQSGKCSTGTNCGGGVGITSVDDPTETPIDTETQCFSTMKDVMKQTDLEGKAPGVAKLLRVLKEGAESTMKSVMENCDGTRANCMAEAHVKAAASLGKKVISKGKAERLNRKAGVKAAKESIEACVAAKKANPDATCDDAFAKYLETRQQANLAKPASEKTLKARVLLAAQAVAVKDSIKLCFESTTESSDFKQCMQSAKADRAELATAIFGEAVKQAKQHQCDRAAVIEYLGEQYESCMEAAGADAQKQTECDTAMAEAKTKIGTVKEAWAIVKEFNAEKIKEGIIACFGEDKKQCRADAKEEFKRMNKARKFLQEKKIAEIKAAAEVCAACFQEGLEDATCAEEAKEAYLEVSGANGTKWAEHILPKVTKVCTGLRDGLEIIMKKIAQLSVDTQTDGTSCQASVQKQIVDMVTAVQTTPALTEVKEDGCRAEGATASYTTNVNTASMDDAQSEAAADAIAESLQSATLTRRLSARRLEDITEVGAATDTELCATTDATCGQSDFHIAEEKPCNKQPLLKAFDACMKMANGGPFAETICKTVLNAAMEQHCGLTPSKDFTAKLITELARTALTECLLKSETDADKEKCRKGFETVTGITDKVTGKLEEIRGAMDSVAAKMKTCTDNAQTCKDDLMNNLKKLTGKDITKDELRTMLDNAGRTEAALKIKDCISMAADANAQKTCFLSDKAEEAKQAFAAASGRLVTSIKNSELYQAVEEFARQDAFSTLEACWQGAADATAKKACFRSDDLKRAIADAMGGGAANVKDSKVREFLEKQGKSQQLALISNCAKGGGEDCKTVMKELKAKMTGMLPSQITDREIKKDIMEALPAHISERMQACMAECQNPTACTATEEGECLSMMRDVIKQADLEGKVPEVSKVLRVLKEGAESAMKSVMENCDDTRAKCMAEAHIKAAASLGKTVMSKGKAELLNKKAGVKAAKETIHACVAAKKENPTATCDDAFAKYLETRQQANLAKPSSEKTLKAKVLLAAQAIAVKDSIKLCFDSTAEASDFKECMQSAKADQAEVATAIFGEAVKQAKQHQCDRAAVIEYLGEKYESCMEAAGADAQKQTECDTAMAEAKTKIGTMKEAWAIVKEFNAEKIKEGIIACFGEDKKQCRADAKEDFKQLNKARKFMQQKKIAEIKAAAEACAACSQEGLDDAVCAEEAKEAYLAVSGADGAKWAEHVLPKVKLLCTALRDGLEIVMKKIAQLSVDAQTDGTSCQASVQDQIVAMIGSVQTTPALTAVDAIDTIAGCETPNPAGRYGGNDVSCCKGEGGTCVPDYGAATTETTYQLCASACLAEEFCEAYTWQQDTEQCQKKRNCDGKYRTIANINQKSAVCRRIDRPPVVVLGAISQVKQDGCRPEGAAVTYTTNVNTASMDDVQSEAAADAVAASLQSATLTRRLSARRLEAITEVGADTDSELCSASDTACGQSAFSDASTPGGDEQIQQAQGMAVKVLGQSGKFSAYSSAQGQNDPDKVTIEMDALREVDTSGNQVGKAGSTKHSIENFASQSFTFSSPVSVNIGQKNNLDWVSALKMNFKSTVSTIGKIGVDTYIMTSNGVVGPEGEPWSVTAGDIKFNFELSEWTFCATETCSDGVGNAVEVDVKIKGRNAIAVRAPGSAQKFDLGGGIGLQLTNKVMVDGIQKEMPAGYPKVKTSGDSQVFTFHFPKFTSSALYDPLLTMPTEAVVASQAAGYTLSFVFVALLSVFAVRL